MNLSILFQTSRSLPIFAGIVGTSSRSIHNDFSSYQRIASSLYLSPFSHSNLSPSVSPRPLAMPTIADIFSFQPAVSEDYSRISEADLDNSIETPGASDDDTTIQAVKRTYQPNFLKRKRTHGFLSRISTKAGRRVIARRIQKGRWRISI